MTRSLPGKKDSWMGMTGQGEISSSALFARVFPIVNNSDRLLKYTRLQSISNGM